MNSKAKLISALKAIKPPVSRLPADLLRILREAMAEKERVEELERAERISHLKRWSAMLADVGITPRNWHEQ